MKPNAPTILIAAVLLLFAMAVGAGVSLLGAWALTAIFPQLPFYPVAALVFVVASLLSALK